MFAALVPLAQQGGSGGGLVGFLLPLLLMGAIFYFLLIRPQQRRARQQRQLLESLEVGDEVMTIGGLFGTIRALDDDRVTVEVAPGIELNFIRSAVARKLVFDEGEADRSGKEEEEEAGDQT